MVKLGAKKVLGTTWDERGKGEIVQILVSHSSYKIHSIQFVYVENGRVHHSDTHGQPTGVEFDMVTFDYPSEYLISVSGHHNDNDRLTSLAFGTNKRKYGPFGQISPSPTGGFNYRFGRRSSFDGFYGNVWYGLVNHIGVYIKPIMSLAELNNKPTESLAELHNKI